MSKPRILIIDDDQGFANVLKTLLQTNETGKKPYEIDVVHTLDNGISKLEDENSLPNLIITDLRLDKGIEGLAIFDYLKTNNLDIPTVILTAFGDKKNLLKCLP